MGIRSSTWCWRVGIWQGCSVMPASPDILANIIPTYSMNFNQSRRHLLWTANRARIGPQSHSSDLFGKFGAVPTYHSGVVTEEHALRVFVTNFRQD